jgi:hypothetical protein
MVIRTRARSASDRSSWSSSRPGACDAAARSRPRRGIGLVDQPQAHELLGRPDRQALGHDPLCDPLLFGGGLEREQRLGVAGGQDPGGDPSLDRLRQGHQAQSVADRRA